MDVSNYSGRISADQILCLKEQGVNYLISLAQDLDICRQQLAIAQEAGMRIACYDYLYYEDPTFDLRRQRAITIAKEFGGLEVWLDVEDEDHQIGPAAVVSLTKRAAKFCEDEGLRWGIYTSRSKWLKLTANSQEFKDKPLWDAYYLNRPKDEAGNPIVEADDIGFSEPYMTSRSRICQLEYFTPYGGWESPTIKQAAGSTNLCGITVDLNYGEPLQGV